jgi:hypothetical protein
MDGMQELLVHLSLVHLGATKGQKWWLTRSQRLLEDLTQGLQLGDLMLEGHQPRGDLTLLVMLRPQLLLV